MHSPRNGAGVESILIRMTSASLHKEPLLVEAGGAGLERGRRNTVIGVVHRLHALLAQRMVEGSILKTISIYTGEFTHCFSKPSSCRIVLNPPYFSEDKFLVSGEGAPSTSAQLDRQVGADAVAHDAPSRCPGVIAELAFRGVFKKL